jgi:Yip1 domain.
MQERVDRGEMTQEQMEQTKEMTESSIMVTIFGSVTAVIYLSVAMFGIPLVFWLVVKLFFKANAPYKKILEIYGLSSVIGIVNAVITLLLINLFVSIIATPGASLLLIGNFEPGNFSHSLIASLNFLTIWQMAIFGIGLAKISNKSAGTGIGTSLGIWVIWIIIVSFIGSMMK